MAAAGCNVVDHIMRERLNGVEFFEVDTDARRLNRSAAAQRLQLDNTGLDIGETFEADLFLYFIGR